MAILTLLATGFLLLTGQPTALTGIVRDPTGAPISNARVTASVSGAPDRVTRTDLQGRFTLGIPDEPVSLVVTAPGFNSVRRVVRSGDARALEVTLLPSLAETVTVTPGRIEQRLANVAAAVSVVDRERLDRAPASTTDDVLRQVPAFSLFRRSSSVAAHPTAQGVSLRGIGPSGVSRTLVLLDGTPFNDPFGGWVSWARVPRASVDRIEVVEGSSANAFGNYSMGGAINLVTGEPTREQVNLTLQYGQRATPRADLSLAGSAGGWSGLLDVSAFSTAGYPVVAEQERGAVDEAVAADARNLHASGGYRFAGGGSIRARAGWFDESRLNGKRSTVDGAPEENSTTWSSLAIHGRQALGDHELRGAIFGDRVRFRSSFLAVPPANPARSFGRISLKQFVPSSSAGGALQWTRASVRWPTLTAGVDWRSVEGESREEVLDAQTGTRVVLTRAVGGAQHNLGAFAQAIATPLEPLVITLGARHDRWTNTDGHDIERTPEGELIPNSGPELRDRSDAVTSPHVSALFRATSALTLWTSAGWGFRAPTLNELYRQFRVGSVITLANEALGPERLRTIDAGLRLTPGRGVTLGVTWFDNALRDAVSNVTLSTGGGTVTQQRQNLGLTRIRGLRIDADWRPSAMVRLSGGYMFNDAVVEAFEASPELVGKRLAQVPAHRGTMQLVLAEPRLGELAVTLMASDRQFDDDLNMRTVPGEAEPGLPGFATVDVMASRRFGGGISAFVEVQNLFDERPFVGTLPTTLGAPRLISAGLRWRPFGWSR